MASNKKDMRREDLIVPYVEPAIKENPADVQGTMSSALPMVAIFTRNKMIGWTAVLFAVQAWLAETPASKASSSSPGYFSVLMAVLALGSAYMPLFLPPVPSKPGAGTATGAPAAMPQ